ncbi:hypothetical protein FKV24_012625 [Lysobacter maris]|uniref:Uncharacterized protein n=1 Tax=Marilutibacter maris TaxID=1605891 RepID=A0A508AJ66_9GAMM|nr:hypothetical protein [Lysobacter maris]KAB8180174.1 hypothetical protein FKV24_012625 [Lysobacter maris]
MSDRKATANAGSDRDRNGRFAKGNAGKRPGTRARATVAAEKLLDGEARKITRRLIEKALEGDPTALKLAMERICPVRRDSPIKADLPPLTCAGDVVGFMAGVVGEIAGGRITPSEGERLAKLAGELARVSDLVEIEARLRALEEAHAH